MQEGESEFVSALNAALEGFVHRTLKEQKGSVFCELFV